MEPETVAPLAPLAALAAVVSVDDVVARLEQIEHDLPPEDGVACFNRMYLTVTTLVRDRLVDTFFADPGRMRDLDVTFASRYLEAVRADLSGEALPEAWAPLFARRHDRRVTPLQFALAGMNAHINHDLPVAVVRCCLAAGTEPDRGSFHHDYLRVNELLAQVDRQVRQSFLDGLVLQADREAAPVVDLVSMWSIDRARDAAWVNAGVLWHLRHLGPVFDLFAETLAGSVGLVTGTLLVPVPG